MQRILFTLAVLALAPTCVHAQAAAPKPDAATAASTPRKSHSPFGAAILELTRAAREQSMAEKAAGTSPSTAAPGEHAARNASKPAPVPAATASAPVLADSNRP